MLESTLSAKNRIVIPKEAREALGVKAGDRLFIVVRGTKVIVLQKLKSPHATLRGLGRQTYLKSYLEKERQSWT